MLIRVDRGSELLDFLYSAVGDLTLWNEFLVRVTKHLDAQMSALVSIDPASERCTAQLHTGWPSDSLRRYDAYYGGFDSWYLGFKNQGLRAWAGTGDRLCPSTELEKTEFYNDFLRPNEAYHECALIQEDGRGKVLALSLVRPRQAGEFDTRQIQFLARLAPHLAGALEMHRKMLDLKHAASAAAEVLESLDAGLVGVDDSGKICFMNGVAESLLRSGQVLRIQDERIVAHDTRQTTALNELLKTATDPNLNCDAGGSLIARRDEHYLHLVVQPWRAGDRLFPGRLKAVVTISDPVARLRSRADLLSELFGLTPAETRVSMLLTDGLDPSEIATRMRITTHTVRSHLKAIYGKTSVGRQSQLVRLISKLPGKLSA
jgi:DNA-binding CsgD family transcriptional regulator